jgi:glutathione S-transferase
MLTIHHLGRSQSERILWLCEELGLPYRLVRYDRDPVTILAPPALKDVHPLGAAPAIEDGDVVLAESGAIVAYVLARHGDGRLAYGPDHPAFAAYLYWLHFANGTLQLNLSRLGTLARAKLPADHPAFVAQSARLGRVVAHVEARLAASPFLAGPDLTAADIMTVFSLSTMRLFAPLDLAPYPAIRAYLARIGEREPYRRAMAKGDPGFAPMLG